MNILPNQITGNYPHIGSIHFRATIPALEHTQRAGVVVCHSPTGHYAADALPSGLIRVWTIPPGQDNPILSVRLPSEPQYPGESPDRSMLQLV